MALYTYTSTVPTDLTFSAGEVICVIKSDGDWWTGIIGNRTGMFPGNYAKKMEVSANMQARRRVGGDLW